MAAANSPQANFEKEQVRKSWAPFFCFFFPYEFSNKNIIFGWM